MKLAEVINALRKDLIEAGVVEKGTDARVELSFVARKSSNGIVCEIIDAASMSSVRPESVHRLRIDIGVESSDVDIDDRAAKSKKPKLAEKRVIKRRLPEWIHSPFTIEEVPNVGEELFEDADDLTSLDSPAIYRQ